MTLIADPIDPPAPLSARSCFANPDVLVRGWYAACRSKRIKPRQLRSVELGDRRLVVWRDSGGDVHAMDSRCAHLGADLAQGSILDNGMLRCAFHGWCFDAAGQCVAAPGQGRTPPRSVQCYAVIERFGVVWIYAGDEPDFAPPTLPEDDDAKRYRLLALPPQHLRCHPHLVIGNGLDPLHFNALHGLNYTGSTSFSQPEPHVLALRMRGRPNSAMLRRLTGTNRHEIDATFRTVGPGIAWASVTSPIRFHTLFTGRPTADGGCDTQVVLFLPRRIGLHTAQAMLLMLMLLHDDRRVLETLRFRPDFTEADAPLRCFADVVDTLGVA